MKRRFASAVQSQFDSASRRQQQARVVQSDHKMRVAKTTVTCKLRIKVWWNFNPCRLTVDSMQKSCGSVNSVDRRYVSDRRLIECDMVCSLCFLDTSKDAVISALGLMKLKPKITINIGPISYLLFWYHLEALLRILFIIGGFIKVVWMYWDRATVCYTNRFRTTLRPLFRPSYKWPY